MQMKPVLTLEMARAAAAGAEREAAANGWKVVVAVVDDGGHLLALSRLDGAQTGSIDVAVAKARAAVLYNRPTKVFADQVAQGRTQLLGLPGAVPLEGGVPLEAGGWTVGGLGISGAAQAQDGQMAEAGRRALAALAGA